MEVDYYRVEELLTQEERLVRETVRKFTRKVTPTIEECFRAHRPFPLDIVRQMGSLGLFGSTIDGYGCPGMGYVVYGLICQELERGDSALRSFVSVQSSLVMYPIYTFGSEEQKRYWLLKLASGEKIGCFGLTEPDFGSNPAGLRTRAVRDGANWVLSGTKLWISNGSIADVAVVWAKTEDGVIRGFLVERGTPGYSTAPIEGKFSLRAQDTAELVFDDCRIPKENILPEATGIKAPLRCLTQARFGIAWGALGAAMCCYETALTYARERVQFDRPIAGFQLIQQKLVRMINEITKGQLLALRLGRLMDEGKATHAQVSLAKLNNVQEALRIARNARDILGAYGVVDEYPIIRQMLNLESVYTYEGTHNIQTLIVGEDITGIRAFD